MDISLRSNVDFTQSYSSSTESYNSQTSYNQALANNSNLFARPGSPYPDASVVNMSGVLGLIFGLTGGLEGVANSESGEFSLFVQGGFEGGITSYAFSAGSGLIFNLPTNADYEGSTLTYNGGALFLFGSHFQSTDRLLSMRYNSGYYGYSLNASISLIPGTGSVSTTAARHIFTIPYLGYILDPFGAIINYFD